MPAPLPLILLGFIALLAAMVFFVARAVRKESVARQRLATELGFTPVTDCKELQARLAAIRGRQRPGLLHLTHVFRRQEALGTLWLYSLHRRNFNEEGVRRGKRPSKSHYSPLEINAVALVNGAWNWPRCVATPRLIGQGRLATFANRMADTLVEANARRLDFPHISDLDEFYFVASYGATPDLPEAFLHALATAPGLILHLGGDTLTLSWANAQTQPPDNARMRQLVDLARQLAKTLEAA
ncbi:MAG: hypothetical protein Q8Q28_12655 [Pseudomonadota bacterium]|nr:hypothetical protein [Pseudomonadota bacterium]